MGQRCCQVWSSQGARALRGSGAGTPWYDLPLALFAGASKRGGLRETDGWRAVNEQRWRKL